MKKMHERPLTFLWRENHIDYLWASNTTAHAYFLTEGYLVFSREALAAYATKKELLKVKSTALRLIREPKFLDSFEKDLDHVMQMFQQERTTYLVKNLKSLSNQGLCNQYKRLFSIIKKYIEAYRIADPHYALHLDARAIKYIKKRCPEYAACPEVFFSEFPRYDETRLLQLGFTKKERYVFYVIDAIARIRFRAKNIESYIEMYAQNILSETTARTEYSDVQISSMSFEELCDVLQKKAPPDISSMKEREKQFALHVVINKEKQTMITMLSNSDTDRLVKYGLHTSTETVLQGITAYPGIVNGFVRLAPPLADYRKYGAFISSLTKDDVLVASMTTPGLTPAFSKVAAVITDEGGLTSHAALIAREKRLPCVMSTHVATQVLQEGEFVSIDATNGTITRHALPTQSD